MYQSLLRCPYIVKTPGTPRVFVFTLLLTTETIYSAVFQYNKYLFFRLLSLEGLRTTEAICTIRHSAAVETDILRMIDQFLVFIQPNVIIFESTSQMAEMLAMVSLAIELFHNFLLSERNYL